MKELGKNLKEYQQLRLFNKYEWKGIKSATNPKEFKKLEKRNPTIALDILFAKRINKWL